MSFVDRQDVAEVAVKMLREDGHLRATYELIGTEPLGFIQVAEILSSVANREIAEMHVPIEAVLAASPKETASSAT